MKADERSSVLQRWQRRELDVVCATVAFGMGIDRGGGRKEELRGGAEEVEGV
jgi:superfamily II DNA helicase RecQ